MVVDSGTVLNSILESLGDWKANVHRRGISADYLEIGGLLEPSEAELVAAVAKVLTEHSDIQSLNSCGPPNGSYLIGRSPTSADDDSAAGAEDEAAKVEIGAIVEFDAAKML